MNEQRKPSKPEPQKRRNYSRHDVIRAAFLAGQGLTCSEIATVFGNTTRQRISALLSTYGIKALRQYGAEEILIIRYNRKDRKRLEELSEAHEYTPESLAVAFIRAVMDRPGIIVKIINEQSQ